jgi:lipid-A-disaccharide synthase
MSRPHKKRVMIIAGEASGDVHGAGMVRAVAARTNGIEWFGVGGPALRGEGVQVEVDAEHIAVVGITEVLAHAPAVLDSMRAVRSMIRRRRPHLLVLIDFPEFNLNVAAYAKRFGVPVLYYIAPQVWAWRRGRVNKIRERVDHMAVILPFEEAFFRKHHIPVTYVGHPLADHVSPPVFVPDRRTEQPEQQRPVVGILPGSRRSEVERLLALMLDTVNHLARRVGPLDCRIAQASTLERSYLEEIIQTMPSVDAVDLHIDGQGAASVFTAADVVVAASGTVTLEAALAGVPMAVVYRISAFSYHIGRRLVKVPHISLVNLIAGREVVPEFIQEEATAERIAGAVGDILQNPRRRSQMVKELDKVRRRIGGRGASRRVAELVLEMVKG